MLTTMKAGGDGTNGHLRDRKLKRTGDEREGLEAKMGLKTVGDRSCRALNTARC